MRLQVCRMVYEDAVGIGPEDVVSLKEAGRMLGIKLWNVSQLVDDGELSLCLRLIQLPRLLRRFATGRRLTRSSTPAG